MTEASLDIEALLKKAANPIVPVKLPGSRQDLADFIARRGEDLRQWMMVQIDIANFRFINSLFGHACGDQIIETVGVTLARDQRFAWFRMNGDVWVGVGESRPSQSAVEQMGEMRRILAAAVCEQMESKVRIDTSVGVAFGPKLLDLVAQVEDACRQAKAYGRRQIVVSHKHRRVEYSPVIRALLAGTPLNEVIELYHQRIAHRDGSEHYEVLSRCDGLSIGGVICAIERMGLARDFDTAVLKMAIEEIAENAPMHAVNISASSLNDQDAILHFISLMNGRKNIALEITETAVMSDTNRARHAIELLRHAGVEVFLDDYGEGATSLMMLGMPFSYLKLGHELSGDDCPGDILSAVIGLAGARDMPVIAEVVETEGQFKRLFEAGVYGFQGFLVHRPERINARNFPR